MNEDDDAVNLDTVLVHKATPEYLQDLLRDKKQLKNFPNIFLHLEIILEKEINRVREKLFHLNDPFRKAENELPEPAGSITVMQEKVFVPVKENPNYNFVGRLLGPRGLTAKQLEQDLDCKIMVRGRGSLRDKKKEDMNRGKPNWEHLDEDLHVLVTVEDFENRAPIKLRRATETIKAFLEQGVRTPENEDRLKQLQLMELAVLNDKDRQQAQFQQQQQQQQQLLLQQQSMTMLKNQAAAAAAAAAQLLQPNTNQVTNHLLTRLKAPASATYSNMPECSSSTATMQNAAGSPSLALTCTANLSPYLSNSILTNVLCPTNTALQSGGNDLGLPLSHLANSNSLGLSSLPYALTSSLPNTMHATLMGYGQLSTQDQLTAMAAALFSGGAGGTPNQSVPISTQKNKPAMQFYPMTTLTSALVDSANILDYATKQESGSDSLKLRATPGLSGQHRIHPYLR